MWNIDFPQGRVLFMLVCLSTLLACNPPGNQKHDKIQDSIFVEEQISNPIVLEKYLSVEYLTGKYDPSAHEDFIEIDIQYADRKGLFARKDVYEAFKQMHEKASEDGLKLVIRSAARNYEYQKGIWEKKWDGRLLLEGGINAANSFPDPKERAVKILEYSAMPGTSRHHWGTDLDFNSFNNEWFSTGEGKKIYDWLVANAGEFGFCQTYTIKDSSRPFGYNEEKWHWSYFPVSSKLTAFAKENFSVEMIHGFKGDETTEQIKVLDHYILGINQDCIKK